MKETKKIIKKKRDKKDNQKEKKKFFDNTYIQSLPNNKTNSIDNSSARVQTYAPCSVLKLCGGCTLQTIGYQKQLEDKNLVLKKAFTSLGFTSQQKQLIIGLNFPFGYRTKLLMRGFEKNNCLHFGFYQQGSTKPIETEGCPIQHPLATAVLTMAQHIIMGQKINAYPKGWLHAIGIRVIPKSFESEMTLVGTNTQIPTGKELIEKLICIPTVKSIHLCTNTSPTSFPLEPPFHRLAGKKRIAFYAGKHVFFLSPGTFFQTNSEGADLLFQEVLRLLPKEIDCFVDLYAGAGIFSLITKKRWKRAFVAEQNPIAIDDLNNYLKHCPIDGLTIIQERVEYHINEILSQKPDIILLDPPRKGCHQNVLEALKKYKPPCIIYISCGFPSFLTDADILCGSGYKITEAIAIDMFPHTPHVESVTRFEC